MKEKRHRFLSLKKDYGRYTMHMTQHIFAEPGRKRYSSVSWVVFLDNEHIVLNTYIENQSSKINEKFMDNKWNDFIVKYGYNIDIWQLNNNHSMAEFNKYSDKLLPASAGITLVDIDEAMEEANVLKKEKERMKKQISEINDNIVKLLDELKKNNC